MEADIVERLRYHTATLDRPLCMEAADEIERLRTALGYIVDVSSQPELRTYCRNTLEWSRFQKTTQDASDRAVTSLHWPDNGAEGKK